MERKRIRDLGINIGRLKPGKYNSITDVSGVIVGQKTILNKDVCSGLTVIMPGNGKLNGTLKVLIERKILETEIYGLLQINKHMVDNSICSIVDYKYKITIYKI